MKPFNIAVLGCGVVGSGVVKILSDMKDKLSEKANCNINLSKIVELSPGKVLEKLNIPMDLFCGGGKDLTVDEANNYINELVNSNDIDLVVETIGGSSKQILDTTLKIIKSKKHVVTANKALLALHGDKIFNSVEENDIALGFEASVCGAIPIIKTIKESFVGDEIISISGIMNGTSNYILSKMEEENLSFKDALKLAQKKGYAEADPTLDINGGDAAHKLILLIRLAFGVSIKFNDLHIEGIEKIKKEDLDFANEMDSCIKLICYTEKKDNKIFASVRPTMVKKTNFLSRINGATNAVRVHNKYSGSHLLIGKGAGSLETASAIVSDIVYIARYNSAMKSCNKLLDNKLIDPDEFHSPYTLIFETEDEPGITGLVTTAIGNQNINIDTVGHNRHNKEKAEFSIVTMACSLGQIKKAINEIKAKKPCVMISEPTIIPVLQ